MAPQETLTRRVLIEGYVQGVGYRHFARRAALRLRLSGWVCNRPDGTVEALISGPSASIEAMLTELRRGPLGADVRSVRLAETEGESWQTGKFAIRRGAEG
jgi:acylphosphatase